MTLVAQNVVFKSLYSIVRYELCSALNIAAKFNRKKGRKGDIWQRIIILNESFFWHSNWTEKEEKEKVKNTYLIQCNIHFEQTSSIHNVQNINCDRTPEKRPSPSRKSSSSHHTQCTRSECAGAFLLSSSTCAQMLKYVQHGGVERRMRSAYILRTTPTTRTKRSQSRNVACVPLCTWWFRLNASLSTLGSINQYCRWMDGLSGCIAHHHCRVEICVCQRPYTKTILPLAQFPKPWYYASGGFASLYLMCVNVRKKRRVLGENVCLLFSSNTNKLAALLPRCCCWWWRWHQRVELCYALSSWVWYGSLWLVRYANVCNKNPYTKWLLTRAHKHTDTQTHAHTLSGGNTDDDDDDATHENWQHHQTLERHWNYCRTLPVSQLGAATFAECTAYIVAIYSIWYNTHMLFYIYIYIYI